MCSGIIDVTLNRDAPSTPWGFRLHGGKDIGYPLVIQRVFMGTPSEGDLQRGDTILQIQGRDSADLTHMEAHDLIKAASTRLQLLIRRLPGAPLTPTTPISPLPTVDGMHPYAKLLRETESSRTLPKAAPMFQPMSPPRVTPQPMRTTPQPVKTYCYSPLPTTPILDNSPIGGFFTPTPRNQADAELLEFRKEKYLEKDAIVNQGYRTLPLITPKAKTRHDIPMGSYLRYVHDPNWKRNSTVKSTTPKFGLLPTPTYSQIGHYTRKPVVQYHPGAPNFERNLDESSQLVHHQYNSPMFLYSQRNIDETIKDQTGVAPAKPPRLTVSTSNQANQSGPLSPGTPGTLAPAKPGTKLSNIVDITLSPTFQMIQETEHRSSSPLPEARTPTLPRRVAPGFLQSGPKSFEQERINAFGSPKEVIHQSGSFYTLMSSLYAPQPAAEQA